MSESRNPNGRPAGSPNKLTSKTKDAIWDVFHQLGDTTEMLAWAKENKTDFYTKIWTKLIPQEIHGRGLVQQPPKEAKQETAVEFARKVMFFLNEGFYALKNEEILKDIENSQKPN